MRRNAAAVAVLHSGERSGTVNLSRPGGSSARPFAWGRAMWYNSISDVHPAAGRGPSACANAGEAASPRLAVCRRTGAPRGNDRGSRVWLVPHAPRGGRRGCVQLPLRFPPRANPSRMRTRRSLLPGRRQRPRKHEKHAGRLPPRAETLLIQIGSASLPSLAWAALLARRGCKAPICRAIPGRGGAAPCAIAGPAVIAVISLL